MTTNLYELQQAKGKAETCGPGVQQRIEPDAGLINEVEHTFRLVYYSINFTCFPLCLT